MLSSVERHPALSLICGKTWQLNIFLFQSLPRNSYKNRNKGIIRTNPNNSKKKFENLPSHG